jgi:arginase
MSVMNLHNKKIKIFGVPVDLGSERLGVEMGPTAIRYAGLHDALQHNHIEFFDCGDLAISSRPENHGGVYEIGRIAEELGKMVADAAQNGFLPMVLGGDHSASIGSIAGAAKNWKRLGMIWIDCHPDANTPETSPTGNVHGMTVAISLGHGYPDLVNCCGFSPKVRPEDICIVGAKNIDPGERELLKRLGVKMYTLADVERFGIVSIVDEAMHIVTRNTDAVHVSFDIDALDPLIAPGTGITSRGGLSYREISYMMQVLGENGIVESIDMIEINPLLDIRNQTSELAVELLLAAIGGAYGDYERNYLKV